MSQIKIFFKSINLDRDSNVKFHAIASLFLKLLSLIVNFSLVPLTIDFFGVANYGLYTALMVISGWFVFLDIGMSQSFRNRVSTYYASNDLLMTKTFISTTYAIFGILGLSFFIIFIALTPFINYSSLLGQIPETNFNIAQVFLLVIFFSLFNFANRLITIILMSTQNTSVPVLLSLVTNIVILLLLYFLNGIIERTLINLILIYFLPMTLIWIFTSIFLFLYTYADIRPSFRYIKFGYIKDLLNTGSQFFILQIENVVIFSSTSFIILKLFTPTDVAIYATAVRFFSIIQLIFALVMNVYWSAISEAIARQDYAWVRDSIIKLNKIFIIFTPVSILMGFFYEDFFNLWLGESIVLPQSIAIACLCSAYLATFNSIYEYSLNGAGKIGFLSGVAILNLIIFFPLIYYFVYFLSFNIEGIIYAVISCQIIVAVAASSRMYVLLRYKK
jgi:O-antigen/teichoic acid export membrane protein